MIQQCEEKRQHLGHKIKLTNVEGPEAGAGACHPLQGGVCDVGAPTQVQVPSHNHHHNTNK